MLLRGYENLRKQRICVMQGEPAPYALTEHSLNDKRILHVLVNIVSMAGQLLPKKKKKPK